MNKLSKFGYTQKVLQEGSNLIKEVKRLRTSQKAMAYKNQPPIS